MSTPNPVNLNNLDGRYAKPADVAAAISAQAVTDVGQYALKPRTAARSVGQGELYTNVKDYGATGDGTTDDTSAIQSAINANTKGGCIFFPPGNYKISNTLTISMPMVVQGASPTAGNTTYGARITNVSTSGNAFTVSSDQVIFRYVAIANSNTSSSVTSGAAVYFSSGNYCGIERCRISGHWNGIEVNNGYGWSFSDNYVVNSVNYGVYIKNVSAPDAGDQCLVSNTFDTTVSTAAAAIRYESGGGLKILNNKILHHGIGLDHAIADGTTTQDLLVSNCSFEGQGSYGIRCHQAGTTGYFKYVNIVGNQFDGAAANGTVTDVIRLETGVNHVNIKNNILVASSSAIGIHAIGGNGTNGDFYSLSDNHFGSVGTGIQVESTVYGINIGQQSYANVSNLLFNYTAASHSSDTINGTYSRDHGTISTTSSFINLYRIDVADAAACSIQVTVSGILNGVGGYFGQWNKSAYRASGGAAVTLGDIYTPVTVGGAFNIQFDTSTYAGSGGIIIGLQKGGSGSSLTGRIEIRVSGMYQRIIRY